MKLNHIGEGHCDYNKYKLRIRSMWDLYMLITEENWKTNFHNFFI